MIRNNTFAENELRKPRCPVLGHGGTYTNNLFSSGTRFDNGAVVVRAEDSSGRATTTGGRGLRLSLAGRMAPRSRVTMHAGTRTARPARSAPRPIRVRTSARWGRCGDV